MRHGRRAGSALREKPWWSIMISRKNKAPPFLRISGNYWRPIYIRRRIKGGPITPGSVPVKIAAYDRRPIGGYLFRNTEKLFAGEFLTLLVGQGGFSKIMPEKGEKELIEFLRWQALATGIPISKTIAAECAKKY
jgi:hypothetical protein